MIWCSNPGRDKKFTVLRYVLVRRVDVVGVMTRLDWMIWCSNPGRDKRFTVLQYVLVRQGDVVDVVTRLWAG